MRNATCKELEDMSATRGQAFPKLCLKDLLGKLMPHLTDRCPFTPKPKANASVKWG